MRVGILQDFFRKRTEILRSEFALSKSAQSSTVLGNCREFFTKRFLSDWLPQNVFMGTGEIVDSNGKRSGQQDLVLYRAEVPKLDLGGQHLFLAEGVIAAIEVKSSIDDGVYRKIIENFKKVKALERRLSYLASGPFPSEIPTFLFSFEGPRSSTLGQWGKALCDDVPEIKTEWETKLRPDGVFVLGSDQAFVYVDGRNRPFIRSVLGEHEGGLLERNDDSALFYFAVALAYCVTAAVHIEVDWRAYIQAGQSAPSGGASST